MGGGEGGGGGRGRCHPSTSNAQLCEINLSCKKKNEALLVGLAHEDGAYESDGDGAEHIRRLVCLNTDPYGESDKVVGKERGWVEDKVRVGEGAAMDHR